MLHKKCLLLFETHHCGIHLYIDVKNMFKYKKKKLMRLKIKKTMISVDKNYLKKLMFK